MARERTIFRTSVRFTSGRSTSKKRIQSLLLSAIIGAWLVRWPLVRPRDRYQRYSLALALTTLTYPHRDLTKAYKPELVTQAQGVYDQMSSACAYKVTSDWDVSVPYARICVPTKVGLKRGIPADSYIFRINPYGSPDTDFTSETFYKGMKKTSRDLVPVRIPAKANTCSQALTPVHTLDHQVSSKTVSCTTAIGTSLVSFSHRAPHTRSSHSQSVAHLRAVEPPCINHPCNVTRLKPYKSMWTH